VVRAKEADLLGSSRTNQVKSVLGTCVSMGVTVDGKDARTVQQEIDQGLYDEKLQA
jgi:large subunit ribosomal protein L11